MHHRLRVLLASLSIGVARVGCAQVADEGSLVIRQRGAEIGQEVFRVRPSRAGRSGGDSLVIDSRYPQSRPVAQFHAALERLSATTFNFRLDQRSPTAANQVYVTGGPARITVRVVGRGSEAARELPSGGSVVILEDSVFALFLPAALMGTEAGARITAIFPRSGRRVQLVAKRERRNGGPDSSQVVVRLSGEFTATVYLDNQDRLQRVELPESGLEATRIRD